MNNHFNDFEGDSAMTRFLEEFENNLEREVWIIGKIRDLLSYTEVTLHLTNGSGFSPYRKWVDI